MVKLLREGSSAATLLFSESFTGDAGLSGADPSLSIVSDRTC